MTARRTIPPASGLFWKTWVNDKLASGMSDKTLRQLTRAYAKGELDKDQYRKARAELINGILAGEITVPEDDYPSLVKPRSIDDTFEEVTERKLREENRHNDTGPGSFTEPPPAAESSQTSFTAIKRWPLLAGIASVIVISVLVYLLLPDTSSLENGTASGSSNLAGSGGTEDTAANADISEARGLIRSFLKERSWTRRSIDAFLSSWQTLPVDQRQAARDSVDMSRLGNAIYKQLLAEKALSDLDDGDKTLEKQKLLVDFAREMRINDPRIKLSEKAEED